MPGSYDRELYANDYKIALAAHAFEWSFVVTLPFLAGIFHACTDLSWANLRLGALYICLLAANTLLHCAIDNLKCNDLKISLAGDQLLHTMQIAGSWAIWTVWVGW